MKSVCLSRTKIIFNPINSTFNLQNKLFQMPLEQSDKDCSIIISDRFSGAKQISKTCFSATETRQTSCH